MALPFAWTQNGGEYYIPHRLILLARMIDRETTRDLQAAFNITVAEWRVLALTCGTGSSSAAEICTAFETDRAEVSRAVSRLLKGGLIQREPDSSHRQKMRIIPTDDGMKVFEGVRAMREIYFGEIMQDLSKEQRQLIYDGLRSIAVRVDEKRSIKRKRGGAARAAE